MAEAVKDYESFFEALGHPFTNVELFELALHHRSWTSEHGRSTSNERLEFLGDAVLGLAMTEALYENEPLQHEGALAKARAEVVSTDSLADLARSIHLGRLLDLGKGEELSGGRDKDSILADGMEAVFGALYLDAGWETTRSTIQRLLGPAAALAQDAPGSRDFKTRLQELAATKGLVAPNYLMRSSGPDHERTYSAVVSVGDVEATGGGQSKKAAQQAAAEGAIAALEQR